MSQFLDSLGMAVQQLVESLGYVGFFLAAFLETVFPPLPSELIMPFGGFLAARGQFSIVGLIIAGTLGVVVGAVLVYFVARWADDHVIRAFIRRYGRWFQVSEAGLDRTMLLFNRYGELLVFVGRLIPTVRSLISIPAGMERMPLPKFLFYTTLGTALWTAILCYAGYLLGENYDQVLGVLETYKTAVIVIGALIVGLLILFFIYRRLRPRARTVEGQGD